MIHVSPPEVAISRDIDGALQKTIALRQARPKAQHAVVIICGQCSLTMHSSVEARRHMILEHNISRVLNG